MLQPVSVSDGRYWKFKSDTVLIQYLRIWPIFDIFDMIPHSCFIYGNYFKNTKMFTCFDFNLFLLSKISCPALLKICPNGIDDPWMERFFCKLGYKVQLLHASTQNLTFTIVKTGRKLISDFQYQKLHNNNDDKPPKTGRDHVKCRIETLTFADKIDTSNIWKYKAISI